MRYPPFVVFYILLDFLQKERQSRQPALHSQKQHWHSYTNVKLLTELGLLPQGESIALLLCARIY
jgi:hypothetical protein